VSRPRYRLDHVAEYLALRGLGAAVSHLPYRAALSLGWICAAATYPIARSRVAEAKRRMREVFGDRLGSRQLGRIAWQSWRNMFFNGVELLRGARVTRAWLDEVFPCAPFVAVLKQHLATGRGAIFALPHMGNWDLAGAVCHHHGIPLFSVAGKQRNPLVNDYIRRLRALPGVPTFERGAGTMRAVLRELRAAKCFAILPDVRVPEPGVPVRFLGGTANVGPGLASFARHAGVPIFPCLLSREGWTRHRIATHPPLFPDPACSKDEDVRRMTCAVLAIMDEAIRGAPGQWFWYNRRWVLEPLGEGREAPGPSATDEPRSPGRPGQHVQ
jgi:KDO2-lipid IV(A) lauroyltransferase